MSLMGEEIGTTTEDVRNFIEEIKCPERFLEYCKKFHEKERREVGYLASMKMLGDGGNENHVLIASTLLIITWNAARFIRLKKEIKERLEDEIAGAYKEIKDELGKLKIETLEKLDLEENSKREIIKHIFSKFSEKKSIGATGASKILHLLNPHLFMMWDDKIRKAYHKLHSKEQRHKEGSPECYIEFLRDSQKIIKSLLEKKSKDELREIHRKWVEESYGKEFAIEETLLKMLDECNYVKFTLKSQP